MRRLGKCIEWVGCKNRKGYGVMSHAPKKTGLVHRVMYEGVHGKIPDGFVVDHLCYNPSCINVRHMRVCPSSENCSRKRTNKINFKKAEEIRKRVRDGEKKVSLSREYGVSDSFVSQLCNRTWYKQNHEREVR